MPHFLSRVFGICLALGLVGCAHPTPYRPQSAAAGHHNGYAEEQLASDRYRVTFRGNRLTSRETVEAYLLYRAAELTVAHGDDWFAVIDHEMDHRTTREIRVDPYYRPWFGPTFGTWQPYWRYYLRDRGWYDWDPYHADPFWADRYDERQIEEFEATAEIRTGRGPTPANDGRVYDARHLMDELRPRIVTPDHE